MRRFIFAFLAVTLATTALAADPAFTVTPYGFVNADALWSQGIFATKDYPGQVLPWTAAAPYEGQFILSIRQSRLGVRATATWSEEFKTTGVFEMDAAGGYPTQTLSTAWANPLPRVRIAYVDTVWQDSLGLLIGEAFNLIDPGYFWAKSVAYTAFPLFWKAGNVYSRVGQIRAYYRLAPYENAKLTMAAALVTPQDGQPVVDNGPGNQSRSPGYEVGAWGTFPILGKTLTVVGGAGYHTHTRRYFTATGDLLDNVQAWMFSANVDVQAFNGALGVMAQGYTGRGADDTMNGILVNSVGLPTQGTGASAVALAPVGVATSGGFFQAYGNPIPGSGLLTLTFGMGVARANEGDMTEAQLSPLNSVSKNVMLSAGALVYPIKNLRYSFEWVQTKTTYLNGQTYTGNQFALATQFVF